MDTTKLIEHLLKHVQLDNNETETIEKYFTSKTLRKKEFLLRTNEVCRTENFILEGCFRTYSIDENGFERTLIFSVESWWIADLLSFLTERPSSYNIVALENAKILQIKKNDLEKLYLEVPKLERYFRILIQNAYISQLERINQNYSLTAEQRYHLFIQKHPDFVQRIPQKHIASYLGITPVFLSMLRKKR
ncbi:Crp/Fnr family transcriptional regulator [Sphingobacterium haloxyli]|uniref:Cyclic nucleotide-binding domain-containing protein n=1 Tax=Sphingobacterium haloxyli TaxID=2100533 RepID=A0A2S9IUC6_9SPHI|nr:Crp/Fnr family transcriptional regulator [Sphingobacterium haloxyli]PRD44100.1 hypothetical protein C5745_19670 [Sphingobacterium haloxyli]